MTGLFLIIDIVLIVGGIFFARFCFKFYKKKKRGAAFSKPVDREVFHNTQIYEDLPESLSLQDHTFDPSTPNNHLNYKPQDDGNDLMRQKSKNKSKWAIEEGKTNYFNF